MENDFEDLVRKSYKRMYKDVITGKHFENTVQQHLKIESYKETYEKFRKILTVFSVFKKRLKVLDIACGTGGFVLFSQNQGLECYGADIDCELIKIARISAKTLNLKDNFHAAPAEKLPFTDNYFDAIVSNQTMEHVHNLDKAISECIRVLRPGGIFSLVCPDYNSFYEGHYKIFWLPQFPKRIAKIYVRALGKNPDFLDGINYTTKKKIIKLLKKK